MLQGTYLGYGSDAQQGQAQEATGQYFSLTPAFLSLSLSVSVCLSLSPSSPSKIKKKFTPHKGLLGEAFSFVYIYVYEKDDL